VDAVKIASAQRPYCGGSRAVDVNGNKIDTSGRAPVALCRAAVGHQPFCDGTIARSASRRGSGRAQEKSKALLEVLPRSAHPSERSGHGHALRHSRRSLSSCGRPGVIFFRTRPEVFGWFGGPGFGVIAYFSRRRSRPRDRARAYRCSAGSR